MQPTMKLRWKTLNGSTKFDPIIETGYGDRLVLQQWWEEHCYHQQVAIPTGKGEWRDIPIEEE